MVLAHTNVSIEDKKNADIPKKNANQHTRTTHHVRAAQKSTLGDIEVLSGLKEKIEEEASKNK